MKHAIMAETGKVRRLPSKSFLFLLPLFFCTVMGFGQTNLGKDFWLAETPNLGNLGDFAISIANPGTTPAQITITNPVRATVNAGISPGNLQTFTFTTESSNTQSTGIYNNNVYHVTSNQDVVVYDFTPLVNAYSNDAALILPTGSLGKKYRPASYINSLGNSIGSFFGIVATESNTSVKTYDRTGTMVDNVILSQGQYFQRNNGSSVPSDITGWYIEADRPVAVFSGTICTSLGNSTGACDHIDEQTLPLESMANAYIASPTLTRPIGCTTCGPDVFRYVATEDGTTISTSPNVGGGTINKGQFLEISTNIPHVVTSNNKPFYAYQYLISQNAGFPVAGIGDPSLMVMPPVDQFQFGYLFLIPNTFLYDFINVVAPVGTQFVLDGQPVSLNCTPVGTIGNTSYCAAKLAISDGVHRISADKQFGLMVSGFDQFASYGYIGGIGLQPINAGCNTGGPYQVTTCQISPISMKGNATCSDGSLPSDIQWSSTDGVSFSDPKIANPTATVPGYGTFHISLKVTCGANSVDCSSTITVSQPPGGCCPASLGISSLVNPITCPGGSDGAIDLTVTSGKAPYIFSWSNGATTEDISGLNAGTYTVTVTDANGCKDQTAVVINDGIDHTPPTITAPPAVTTTNSAGICGAGNVSLGTPVTGDNCGVQSVSNNAPSTFPVGTTVVTWTVTDINGNSATASQSVTVTNLPPIINSISGPLSPVAVNAPISLTTNFTDNNVTSAVINWEGSSETRPVSQSPLVCSHSYASPGVYTIGVSLMDACNAQTAKNYEQYVVVYDPSGGFVTGGGWINSPAGAYRPDPSLMGKATFGFVSKYEKGKTVPTGNTEFQFHEGNLNFNSTQYEWLVISGSRAQFKGSGTINGSGNYGFLLTAVDGDLSNPVAPDMFRIKIWDKNNSGIIVYDNQYGAADGDALTTVLGGGSIVIHTSKSATTTVAPRNTQLPESPGAGALTVKAFPNPSGSFFTLVMQSGSEKPVNIKVTDALGRIVDLRLNRRGNGSLELGQGYIPGIYFAEVLQGKEKVTIKLVKKPG